MELNWATYLLEILNFLILVWILKRFLYKPVLEAIARRQSAVASVLSDAKAKEEAARTLEQQYRNRLADWDNEKEKMRAGVNEDMSRVREQMMAALRKALDEEREKALAAAARESAERKRQLAAEAALKGTQFTARLLERLACPELEAKIVELVLDDIPKAAGEQFHDSSDAKVTSAYLLNGTQQKAITEKLQTLVANHVKPEFRQDCRLLAGLRISIGPWILNANLQDELQFFATALSHDLQSR